MPTDFGKRALALHREARGKLAITSKVPLATQEDLSLAYTPGVAAVSEAIAAQPDLVFDLTMKGNSVAVVSNGSAVLGLGDIGPHAALPVMEGKALLLKALAGIEGIPIVINATETTEIVAAVRAIAPTFGGINLEDIAAPICFEVEEQLQDLGIPVFHDDQHGTAIVLLAALMNAATLVGRSLEDLTVVISGAGAAGMAIAKLLRCIGSAHHACIPVKEIFACDRQGIISRARGDLNHFKQQLLNYTNREDRQGTLREAMEGADVFIGVSSANLLSADDIRRMAPNPIVFAMANPTPEIMPDAAYAGGAAIVGTGRSDFPNQVNNVLAFPGIFRGALDVRAPVITEAMKLAAAHAIAHAVRRPTPEEILPPPLDPNMAKIIAKAVAAVAA
jgi:malate dehydrogenase (oxaloacetate-decarboxylating)